MFNKPIRVKLNSQMKNTERKALKTKILLKFPSLTNENINEHFNNKEPVSVSKIITYYNNIVTVYSVRKCPMFFEHENILFPTIYFLWHFPDLVPCFTTHPPVLSKLCSGADLMLPGVVLPEIDGPTKYGRFEKGTMMAINFTDNKAPAAIGTTHHSSMDMYMCAGRGKCINVLHVLNDYLCQMEGNVTQTLPELGPPDWLKTSQIPNLIDGTKLENEQEIATHCHSEVSSITSDIENIDLSKNSTDEMDALLNYCFFKSIKYSGKKIQLPILTSHFYRTFMINACPSGKQLDIKKTSYKKLNKFLNEMKNENIIHISEPTKGVETIDGISFDHPLVTSFYREKDDVSEPNLMDSKGNTLDVQEAYTVTSKILPIFSDVGLRKGDTVKPAEVRKLLTDYVKKKNLQSLDNRGVVIPNKELGSILKSDEPMHWEEVIQKIFSAMSSSYKINNAGTQVSGKGKVEPIIITVGSRSGNKKVTLVDNLELFGIRAADFGKECQHGVAASTSVTKPIGKKYEQLLVQGNQVAFVGNLLTSKYNIPKRFIRGLELAVKNKK